MPIAALDALFVAFVAVQLTVLFGGSRHVLETAGLTYAEYARQGFWQLLLVSALALVVLAFAARTARYESRTDRILVRMLLGILCAMSVVVVVSAVHRMWTYEQAYGFTELRVFVTTVELWLGSIFVLVAIAGVRLRPAARWLPQAVLAAGVIALLSLAVLNPDRFVAERNIDRYHETGRIDVRLPGNAVRRCRACAGPPGRADALVRARAHREPHRGGRTRGTSSTSPEPSPETPSPAWTGPRGALPDRFLEFSRFLD